MTITPSFPLSPFSPYHPLCSLLSSQRRCPSPYRPLAILLPIGRAPGGLDRDREESGEGGGSMEGGREDWATNILGLASASTRIAAPYYCLNPYGCSLLVWVAPSAGPHSSRRTCDWGSSPVNGVLWARSTQTLGVCCSPRQGSGRRSRDDGEGTPRRVEGLSFMPCRSVLLDSVRPSWINYFGRWLRRWLSRGIGGEEVGLVHHSTPLHSTLSNPRSQSTMLQTLVGAATMAQP